MHGGELHEGIIDLIRFDVMRLLRLQGLSFHCVVDDGFMALLCQTTREGKKASKYPDMLLMEDVPNGETILVEVGQYRPSKWGAETPVLHIGFNGCVSLVNGTGTAFELLVKNAIAGALDVRLPELVAGGI
jgi:hypothetical protein